MQVVVPVYMITIIFMSWISLASALSKVMCNNYDCTLLIIDKCYNILKDERDRVKIWLSDTIDNYSMTSIFYSIASNSAAHALGHGISPIRVK